MSQPKPPSHRLVKLLHFRWSIPTLSALAASGGQARFVTLQKRLGASRGALQRTLAALIDAGLVRRNPGYGHPLRPEYLLTAPGRKVAAACTALATQVDRLGIADIALKKWSLPVAQALASGAGRFNQLQAELDGVTPRALAQALRDLQHAGLIERLLIDDFPPRTEYEITAEGRRLAALATALAKAA